MKDEDGFGVQLDLKEAVRYVGQFSSPEAREDFELWSKCCEEVVKAYAEVNNIPAKKDSK